MSRTLRHAARGPRVHAQRWSARRLQQGLSLVELMIGITLGLVAVAAASTIYLANRQSYAQIESLARLQENARLAADLLAREIREAGSVVCGNSPGFVNLVSGTNTWAVWDRGLLGDPLHSGISAPTGTTAPLSSTDVNNLLVWTASSGYNPVQITSHSVGANGSFVIATAPSPVYNANDVITACDGVQTLTFESASTTSSSSNAVSYSNGASATQAIAAGGFLNPLSAHVWYVGQTATTGIYALRRLTVDKTGTVGANDEMVRGMKDMTITYLQGGLTGAPAGTDYVAASAVSNWALVTAVRIVLTLQTDDKVGASGSTSTRISHTLPLTVGIRSRLP